MRTRCLRPDLPEKDDPLRPAAGIETLHQACQEKFRCLRLWDHRGKRWRMRARRSIWDCRDPSFPGKRDSRSGTGAEGPAWVSVLDENLLNFAVFMDTVV